MNLSGTANLIIDGATLFILAGMMIYTSLYRRRGRTSDKLFLILILTDMGVALLSAVTSLLRSLGKPVGAGVYLICRLLFFLSIVVFLALFCAYHMHRRMSVLMLILVAVHIIIAIASEEDVTPLFFSIYLMFSHLRAMRDPFYGEDAE